MLTLLCEEHGSLFRGSIDNICGCFLGLHARCLIHCAIWYLGVPALRHGIEREERIWLPLLCACF